MGNHTAVPQISIAAQQWAIIRRAFNEIIYIKSHLVQDYQIRPYYEITGSFPPSYELYFPKVSNFPDRDFLEV